MTTCLEGIKKMAPSKFRVEDHEIILYGACKDCAPKSKPSYATGSEACPLRAWGLRKRASVRW